MDTNSGSGVRTATCPICHGEIEIPARAVDAEGNYSIQCMKCKIPVTGKVHPNPGTL